jgi:mannose-1-phosphate guanylyltransferase/mannose-6-phosphate isomerase
MSKDRIVPVVLCGGAGTRLWPVSREGLPKQFIPLIGERSTFQQVLARTSDPVLFSSPIVITNFEFRFIVAEQMRGLGAQGEILLEPVRRDTALAVAIAAERVSRTDPSALILVVAADHMIQNEAAFLEACASAAETAKARKIVTFGLPPNRPAVEYGYISPGEKIAGTGAFAVKAFVEKPKADFAERLVVDGYLWNSGNFVFRADVMLAELSKFEPKLIAAAKDAIDSGVEEYDFFRLGSNAFEHAPSKSIDYAVMERTTEAAIVPVAYGIPDVGNWNAVWDLLKRDPEGNTVAPNIEVLDARQNLIYSEEGILTAVVGLDDIIVIATGDAVLVASRSKSAEIKSLVEKLKQKGRPEVLFHRRVYRPWGHYQTIDRGDRYHVKRIVVKSGGTLSLQKHFHRAEHWVVVKGTAEVTVNDDVRTVFENESIYLPMGSIHRLANHGRIPLELIEVQVGSYLGEDDIVRLEDIYHRG